MKNLIIKSIALTLLIASIYSCSSTPESINVKAKSTKIKGELSSYYQIVDLSYSIAYNEYGLDLKVQLKRTNEAFNFDFDIKEMTNMLSLYCDIYDKEGAPVHLGDGWYGGIFFDSDKAYNIIDLEQGETGWIDFSLKAVDKDKFANLSSFSIRSEVDYERIKQRIEYLNNKAANNLSGSSSTSSVSKTKSGNTNWDKVLADYEAYTDKYVKLVKKANAGDASAMTEYLDMLEKAQNLQESLENADDEMSMSQLNKFNEIQMKLINAASGL
jgi:cytochrome c556